MRVCMVIVLVIGCNKEREPEPGATERRELQPRRAARTDGGVGIASCDHLASIGPQCLAAMTTENQDKSRPFFDGLASGIEHWKRQLAVKDETYALAVEAICTKALEEMQRRFGDLCATVTIMPAQPAP